MVERPIVKAWAAGWALSRDTPPPTVVGEGLRIDVGLPQQRVRYVFPAISEALIGISRSSRPGLFPGCPRPWPVILAEIRSATGESAGRGRMALAGPFGVYDQIETEPEHRRRGLGQAVMRALEAAGAQRGARHGVLGATTGRVRALSDPGLAGRRPDRHRHRS